MIYLGWVALMAFFFAKVEIQIEGAAGWASALPTWRIESHWLLDIFWGGRPMTGYHAWVFSHEPQNAIGEDRLEDERAHFIHGRIGDGGDDLDGAKRAAFLAEQPKEAA